MSRNLLALAIAATLSTTLAACSDSGSDSGSGDTDADTGSGGTTGGGTGTDGGTTAVEPGGPPPAPSGGGAPSGETKAGSYIGNFGFGDGDGVYVIDADNDLAGLTLNEDGSAFSLFGNLGDGDSYDGTLTLQTHDASQPPSAGVFGTGRSATESTGEYNLNFVPGQTIEGGEQASLRFASGGEIPPATIAEVAGSWSSVNQFDECDGDAECRLTFDVTFDGTSVSGATNVEDGDGEPTRDSTPIEGTIAEYGDVLLLSFNWGAGANTFRYDGVAFFAPDGTSRRLVFLGKTDAPESSALPTIATLLSQS